MNKNATTEWWWNPLPICEVLLPIDPVVGAKNVNPVWSAEVLEQEGPRKDEIYNCVFKYLDTPIKLPIEIACAMVGAWMGNHIPSACLVKVNTAELPGAPTGLLHQKEAYLFGMSYVDQNSFYEQLSATGSGAALEAAVWEHFCRDAQQAAKGASLDELISNFDRHCRNMRFDGVRWWLIDHDNSLLEIHGKNIAEMNSDFIGNFNEIAEKLLARRPDDHHMNEAAKLAAAKQPGLAIMSHRVAQWKHPNPEIQAIWTQTSLLLNLLHRRIPMLEYLIGERIRVPEPHTHTHTLPWTPPTTPPPQSPV